MGWRRLAVACPAASSNLSEDRVWPVAVALGRREPRFISDWRTRCRHRFPAEDDRKHQRRLSYYRFRPTPIRLVLNRLLGWT